MSWVFYLGLPIKNSERSPCPQGLIVQIMHVMQLVAGGGANGDSIRWLMREDYGRVTED